MKEAGCACECVVQATASAARIARVYEALGRDIPPVLVGAMRQVLTSYTELLENATPRAKQSALVTAAAFAQKNVAHAVCVVGPEGTRLRFGLLQLGDYRPLPDRAHQLTGVNGTRWTFDVALGRYRGIDGAGDPLACTLSLLGSAIAVGASSDAILMLGTQRIGHIQRLLADAVLCGHSGGVHATAPLARTVLAWRTQADVDLAKADLPAQRLRPADLGLGSSKSSAVVIMIVSVRNDSVAIPSFMSVTVACKQTEGDDVAFLLPGSDGRSQLCTWDDSRSAYRTASRAATVRVHAVLGNATRPATAS